MGLENKMSFYDRLTESDKKVVRRLAEIEKEDANRCAHCGGEDCICCEYYLDRQKWKEPEELFSYANEDIPDIKSKEFIEYVKYMELEDWDVDDAYSEFVNDWIRNTREDYMY